MRKCPECGSSSQIIDSRESRTATRRRRQCSNSKCRARWTTFETIEVPGASLARVAGVVRELRHGLRAVERALHRLKITEGPNDAAYYRTERRPAAETAVAEVAASDVRTRS